MKRKFTILTAALALLVSLAIPMGMWGQTRSEVNYVFSDHYTSNTVLDETPIAFDGVITATFNKRSGGTATQYYTNGSAVRWYGGGTLEIVASNATLSNIEITFTQTANSVSASVGTYSLSNSVGTWSGSTSSVIFTQSGTSGHCRISAIKVTYSAGGSSAVATTVTIDATGITNTDVHSSTAAGQLTATVTYDNNGTTTNVPNATVAWSSSNENVATIDEDGVVTLVAAGTTTITATYAGNTTYATSTGTYQLNVVDNTPSTGTDVTFVAGTDTGSTSVTKDGITVSMSTMSRTDNYRCYANTDMTVVSNVGNISKVVLTCVSGNGANNFSIPTNGVGTYTFSTDNLVGTWTGSSTTVTLHASAQVRITKIVVTYEPNNTPAIIANPTTLNTFSYLSTSTDPSAAQQVTVSGANLTAGITVSVGANSAFEMCTTENGTYSDSDITLTQTNGAVAATSIYVRMKANQTGTPSGTLALSSTGATSVTIALNGSVVTPMTVAEAIAAIAEASGNTVDDAYVSGIVCQIDGYDSSHNSITYWISDDGTTTTKLEVYSGKGLNGANFTSVDDLTVGDEVVVFGDLKMYGEIYEFNYNNYLVSWVHNVIPVISADNVNLLYTATSGAINYSIQNGEGFVSAELTEGDWLVLGEVTANTIPFTCSANTGEERTATITLSFEGANDKIVTVTQAAYVAPITSGTGTITFGSADGSTKINSTSVTGDDNLGNTWTITTVFSGEESFTQSSNYSQVGAAKKPATSITFTATLPAEATISAFEAKFGGFSGTAGTITLKVGEATVGTGALNETNDIVVSCLPMVTGTVLTVTVTNIEKGVKCYYISYTLGAETYTLTIDGYTDDNVKDGYYLIASPVTVDPATVKGMTYGDFDLYYFDQSQDDEWRNYEAQPFNLEPGKGYLYAKKATADTTTYTFNLTGTPNQLDGFVSLILDNNDEVEFQGWNLIGNPFGEAASLDMPFYRMNTAGTELEAVTEIGSTVNAMEGVFVIAEMDPETGDVPGAQFTVGEGTTTGEGKLVMNVGRNGNAIDRAIVRFDEGRQLPKFQLNPNHTKLYVTEGNQDLAVVRSASEAEMPVSFKAENNGTYTISVNAEDIDMEYLHLIDNMTGADIDLLKTPSYSFNAKVTDYANRFRLMFRANDSENNNAESFAFYNNGNITVNGNGILNIVDVLGRTVLTQELTTANCQLSTANIPAGVYTLQLVNGDKVKTQKVVVK